MKGRAGSSIKSTLSYHSDACDPKKNKVWFALMNQDSSLMRLDFTRKRVRGVRFMHAVLVLSGLSRLGCG